MVSEGALIYYFALLAEVFGGFSGHSYRDEAAVSALALTAATLFILL